MHAIITAGAAGSGKSTWARNVAEREPGKYIIIERDAIRTLQGFPPIGSPAQERFVTKVQRGQIEIALADGLVPIIADTHTNKGIRNAMIKFLHKQGADVHVHVINPDLTTVFMQNAKRGEAAVPDKVVRKMWQSLESQRDDIAPFYPVQRFEAYEHGDGDAIVVIDIDGTVADSEGVRSPYDYTKVGLDNPRADVIETVRALGTVYPLFFVSGRDGSCREDTERWLDKHVTEDYTLLMRQAGDSRPDFIVKNEIADNDLIPNYRIVAWLDDRMQVIRHVRARGINVMDVAGSRF